MEDHLGADETQYLIRRGYLNMADTEKQRRQREREALQREAEERQEQKRNFKEKRDQRKRRRKTALGCDGCAKATRKTRERDC